MEVKKQTWRDLLHRQRGSHFKDDWSTNYRFATKLMQEEYPGNYIVEEFYNTKIQEFDLRLKFDTPEDETLFHLKYE